MLRALLCAVVGLAICTSGLLAAESEAAKKKHHGHEGTVTKVSGDEITVQTKDREGKEHEHTINTKEKVRLTNMEGKPAEASDFKVGDKVTVYLHEGKVVGLRAGHGHHKEGGSKEGGSKEGGSKEGGSKEGGSESK